MNPRSLLAWWGSWVALLALSVLLTEGVLHAEQDVDAAARLVSLALSISWLATLLMPQAAGKGIQIPATAIWATLAAAGFFLLSLWPGYFTTATASLSLAGGVLILVVLFSALHMLMLRITRSPAAGRILYSLIVASFLTAPLYLGVLAELFPDRRILTDIIVAASPISYFAGIIDIDYLRSAWFYQHAPFGGLRFEYPDPGVLTVAYILVALTMMGVTTRFTTLMNNGERP